MTLVSKLSSLVCMPFEIRFHKNRSSMICISRNRGLKVHLHEMFLEAPPSVIEALAAYIKGAPHKRSMAKTIKLYIHDHLDRYPSFVNPTSLVTQGKCCNLKTLFDELNARYFNPPLEVNLSWVPSKKGYSKVTLGQYVRERHLIKMSDRLDSPKFPLFFVKFVLYHEMLHVLIKPHPTPGGRLSIHSPLFKSLEKKFENYLEAKAWQEKNRFIFFK